MHSLVIENDQINTIHQQQQKKHTSNQNKLNKENYFWPYTYRHLHNYFCIDKPGINVIMARIKFITNTSAYQTEKTKRKERKPHKKNGKKIFLYPIVFIKTLTHHYHGCCMCKKKKKVMQQHKK